MLENARHILLVDDNFLNLEAIKLSLADLEREGIEILVATNGKAALSIIDDVVPQLILLDINLPDISGLEICKYLKSDERTENIPVIFLSGRDDIASKLQGFKVGGVDYITKPFDQKEVYVRVKTQLKIYTLTQQVEQERVKSDKLLHNIFPSEVVKELKETGMSVPVRYESVSVLFTDFKGFTRIAERLSTEELVNEVDFCFRTFDEIIKKYGIEKIKTIGDAYLCVAGLPTVSTDHADKIVMAAIEMRDFMVNLKNKRMSQNKPYFEMRLGIHTGPVVAGIVGSDKFAYDIWGDTVNTASHMESSGEHSKINISGYTFKKLKQSFNCTYRGKVEAKNKGEIDMYFAEPS